MTSQSTGKVGSLRALKPLWRQRENLCFVWGRTIAAGFESNLFASTINAGIR
jgi:hypothetical protein